MTDKRKTVGYAYPSSPFAVKLQRDTTGCYFAAATRLTPKGKVKHELWPQAFDSAAAAHSFAKEYYSLPWDVNTL